MSLAGCVQLFRLLVNAKVHPHHTGTAWRLWARWEEPQWRQLGKQEIAMIFTAQKKTLCIALLALVGLVLIGIGVTRHNSPHRIIPTVLGGALIAVAVYVVTIEPGEYSRRRRRRRQR
jgi:hypothetical protein